MAYSKQDLFNEELQVSSEFFKALGHPARLAILKYLAEMKVCINGDLTDVLPLSRTTINQHLRGLKDVGLIAGTIEGAKTCYCLNQKKIKELKKLSGDLMKTITISENSEKI